MSQELEAAVAQLEAPTADVEGRQADRIAGHVRGILEALGLDLDDPNLHETDQRVARMYQEMFHGLKEGSEPKITTFPNDENYQAMVMERDLPFYSMCAHHLVPFYGHAHIAYIPIGSDPRAVQVLPHPRVLRQAAAAAGDGSPSRWSTSWSRS